jgi:hypothetical protein
MGVSRALLNTIANGYAQEQGHAVNKLRTMLAKTPEEREEWFSADQWWFKELSHLAFSHGTDDQKRAVAVVSNLLSQHQQQYTKLAELVALSVTKIMLDVVPGFDGMGEEVYAKSVAEVTAKFSKMVDREEELENEVLSQSAKKAAYAQELQELKEVCSIWEVSPAAQALSGRTGQSSSLNGKPDDYESRKLWSARDWYVHLGAWENDKGQLCFGSNIAFAILLGQFHRTHAASAPGSLEDGEQL